MKKLSIGFLVILISISLQGCVRKSLESPKYDDLRVSMRSLWHDHVLWTRNVIICIVDETPGATDATNRLLKNQEDIGNVIRIYYGDEPANTLTDLLKTHITTAADLVNAADDGNTTAYNTAYIAWYANADEIAEFLNSANPDHWELQHWKDMLKDHLDHTIDEVVARIDGNYVADVEAYDMIVDQAEMMADELSEGIALHHPEDF